MRTLVDNNIQIYKTTALWWKTNLLDNTFDDYDVSPVVSDYVLMEYRKTIIRAIGLLSDLIGDVKGGNLNERIVEILNHIVSSKKAYASHKMRNLLVEMLSYYHLKRPEYLEGYNTDEFPEFLKSWAEQFELFHFFVFKIDGVYVDIRDKYNNAYVDIFSCPLARQGAKYTCNKTKQTCKARKK